ncbi:MAG TPA: M13 family metallopeptidase [Thermoanaerobaculia bacterium]|nr:M13 family metallopeptidase [Thermoanaerobaculia bacterium]
MLRKKRSFPRGLPPVLLTVFLVFPARAADVPAPANDVLRAHLDTSTSPAVDFFQYANGGWLAKNPIPPSESGWGIGDLVDEEIYARIRKIDEDAAAADAPPGSDVRKIGDFWTAAMDEKHADALGITPLAAELDRIDAVRDMPGVIDAAMAEMPLATRSLLSFRIAQDDKKSDTMAVTLWQGGLGLPNREFYFRSDENSTKVRAGYRRYVQRLLELSARGRTVAPDAADRVIAFETALAKASRPLADLRDPEKNYNKMPAADLRDRLTPSIDWPARLVAVGVKGADTVIVGQPEFYSALETELKKTPLEDLKNYLRFHLIDAYAEELGKAFDDARFDFRGRVLSGQEEQRPRWKRVIDAQERAMGMVVGRVFVQAYFPERAKKRYSDLVEAIRDAWRDRIERLPWMSAETKAKALEKLAKMTKKVGYPDKWKDYSTLAIGRESFAANMMAGARWRFDDMVGKFGKPVDRTEWEMTPQTYNAYYNPSNNEIVLPAAAFTLPGVADDEADDALVYGYAAASTIGHEMSHGFDDEGRQFDAAGNLTDWWTKEDADRFRSRAERMVVQFDAFEPLPGMHINGKASLGENIADLGGVLVGLDAFEKTEQYRKGEKIAGLTPLQRYFLGYALSWLGQIRKETLARHLLSDVHAPEKWRVNGPLANVSEFDEAFGVKPGDPMWRSEEVRVHIW